MGMWVGWLHDLQKQGFRWGIHKGDLGARSTHTQRKVGVICDWWVEGLSRYSGQGTLTLVQVMVGGGRNRSPEILRRLLWRSVRP